MKKLFALLLCLALLLTAVGCGGSKTESDNKKAKFTVGICQLVQHEALDAATKGFKDALKEALGDDVAFDEQNASGEAPNCTTIVNGFVSSNVDLILANATPALSAAASATDKIPVLGTSITEYGVALGLKDFKGTVGTNVSGTSDLAPLNEQAAMIKEWMPDVKKVGLLYCSAEPNSAYQVETIAKELSTLGVETKASAFTDTNDVASVTQSATDWSDAIYIPTDNTAASNTEAIANITVPAKKPVFTGEEGPCKSCGVATLTINYYDLGVATGKMAVKILKGESKVSEMPIEYAPEFTKKFNKKNAADFGFKVPDGYKEIEG